MSDLSEIKQQLVIVIKTKNKRKAQILAEKIPVADLAQVLTELKANQFTDFFRLIDNKRAAAIFPYLTPKNQATIVELMSATRLKAIMAKLYSDDLVDLIDDLPTDLTRKIIEALSPTKRRQINRILRYEETMAGAMMSVNFIEVRDTDTIYKVLKKIRDQHEIFETFDDLLVVDRYGILRGQLELKELLIHNPKTQVKELLTRQPISISSRADREEVVETFKKYDIDLLPVVNSQNRVLGFITSDDVFDVIEAESTEDIVRLAGVHKKSDSDYFATGLWKMFSSRVIWLIISLLLGTITQILVLLFWKAYQIDVETLAPGRAFGGLILLTPMLITLAGIIGIANNQSSTLVVRSIATGHATRKTLLKILYKEFLLALMFSVILVAINILRLMVVYSVEFSTIKPSALWYAIATSSILIVIGLVLGNLFASSLPFILKRLKFDPTIASAPLVTTISDMITVSLLFGIGLAFF